MYSIVDFVNVYGLLVCAACLLWYYSVSTFDYWKKRNIVFKKPFPFFGNTGRSMFLMEPMHTTLDKLYAYFGSEPCGGVFQMRIPTLLIKDPQLITDIFTKDFHNFPDHGFENLININKDLNPLNEHIFAAQGERWRALRQKMSPIFTSGKLKFMHEQIYNCVRILDEHIASKMTDDGLDVPVKKLYQGLTIDVIGTCAFGISCNATSSDYIKFKEISEKAFKMGLRDVAGFVIAAVNKKILNLIKLCDMKKDIQDFYLNLILDVIAYRRSEGINRNDALQLLISMQNAYRDKRYAILEGQETILKQAEEFDEIDVAANAFIFFIAGFETTAATLAFCTYELALNSEVQNKLRHEVERIQRKYQKQTPESLKELTYMDGVIKEEFDEIDIAANAFIFFVAGFETTAATLSFCTYELAINTEIQNKLRLEAERIQRKYQKQTPESLKELTYMDSVIKETLRKYPPVPVLGRLCRGDYVISTNKIHIPTGTNILIPVWSIHHDPQYYPNPEVFDPDRFNSDNNQNRPNGTYIPFGDGPRQCLGKRFAEMEIKAALAELILKYDFSPSPKTEIPFTYKSGFMLQPVRDLLVRIKKRKI